MSIAGESPVFGLPGYPVSYAVTFDIFVSPAIQAAGGCLYPPRKNIITARLTRNIPSTTGREDYVPVTLKWQGNECLATPVFGESNLITTLIRADGLAVVPIDIHGLTAGETAHIRLF